MRRSLLFSALLVLAACFPSAASAAPERYIVVLKDGVPNSAEVASEHSRRHGASVGFVYGHALKGYSATIPSERVAALRADSRVDYVVPDGVASAVAQTLPWGIDRIDADTSSTLAGNGAGAVTNVNAYVIDSGIAAHPDLNLVGHVNFANGKNTDCNGHGTHVAGTIAARDNASDVVGVAPGAPLTGVKVLGCNGSGSWSGVIKGIDWVTANATKPAVANMSLGGGANQAVDDAVRSVGRERRLLRARGGQRGRERLQLLAGPRAGTTNGIVTTAATDSLEREASWSNFGPCVDIWSPGVSILSTRRGGGTTTMSGTSMASPHSAGGGALYLSTHPGASASAVESALKASATSTGTLSKTGRAIKRLYVGGF